MNEPISNEAVEAAKEFCVEIEQLSTLDGLKKATDREFVASMFQSAITKACAERDVTIKELDRQVTLNRENWRMDAEEKDRKYYALSSQLAVMKEALEKITERAYEAVVVEHGKGNLMDLPNELQCIADAALANLPAVAEEPR